MKLILSVDCSRNSLSSVEPRTLSQYLHGCTVKFCPESIHIPTCWVKHCIVRVLVPFSVYLSPDIVVELVVLMFCTAKGHSSSLNSEASYPDMFLGVFAKF